LLQGTFQGKDKIMVDIILDDENKPRRLDFKGVKTVVDEEETVGAVAGDNDEAAEEAPSEE